MYCSVICNVSRVVKVSANEFFTSDFTMISPAGKNIFEPAKTTTLHVSNTNLVCRIFHLQGPDILTGFYIVYVRFYRLIPLSCEKPFLLGINPTLVIVNVHVLYMYVHVGCILLACLYRHVYVPQFIVRVHVCSLD